MRSTPKPTWGTAPVRETAGRVEAVVEAGSVVFLAGSFTGLKAPSGGGVARPHLAALDADSGHPVSFDAGVDGPVRALALSPDGRRLYLGGDFESVGGRPAPRLAAVDAATGAPDTSFRPPRLNAEVRALALAGGRLYAGGNFTEAVDGAKTVRRPQLAAFDAVTGALLDWSPPVNAGGEFHRGTGEETVAGDGMVHDLALSRDGKELYVAGTFVDFGGRKGLLSLKARSGRPSAWQAEMARPVFGLAVSPGNEGRLYAAAGGAGGRLLAFDPGGSPRPVWEVKTDRANMAVLASSTTVYLLGHYHFIVAPESDCHGYCPGGPERHHLAAFDARTGRLGNWNPDVDTPTGPYSGAMGARHLWVGGEFTTINGASQPGIAQFPGVP